MNKLRELWASLFIPKNTPYCHHGFKKHIRKYCGTKMYAKSCKYLTCKYNKEWECKAEYCKYLHKFLDIQDQVKDCGVNEDYE